MDVEYMLHSTGGTTDLRDLLMVVICLSDDDAIWLIWTSKTDIYW